MTDLNYDANKKTRAVLALVSNEKNSEKVFEELRMLADTAGYEVVGEMFQLRDKPDNATCFGSGKLLELKDAVEALEADIVIFDNDINGSQFFNIESVILTDAIDRKTLILEIFARHATSNEGKLQVELATKRNLFPRIIGKGIVMSRQGGGGAGGGGARRGGGEQKLELDRRTLKKEINDLEDKIKKLSEERALRRIKRQKNRVKTVSIVGYTNAGKSTLMNAMTKADVLVENKLFATLDTVSRKIWLEHGKEFLLTDTVGFISRLPHELVKAFSSTLEEAVQADLIIHTADASSEDLLFQHDVVLEVLESLGVKDTPIITVLNKCDIRVPDVLPQAEKIIMISAKENTGIDKLKEEISLSLFGERITQWY